MVLLAIVNSLYGSFLMGLAFVGDKSSLFSTYLLVAHCRYTAFGMVSRVVAQETK